MKTKPFNLKDALSGAKVVTREGQEVKQLTFFETDDLYCIYGIVNNTIKSWRKNGSYSISGDNTLYDLFIAVPIQRFWVNVYESEFSEMYLGRTHSSLEDAKAWSCKPGYIKTIEITNEP